MGAGWWKNSKPKNWIFDDENLKNADFAYPGPRWAWRIWVEDELGDGIFQSFQLFANGRHSAHSLRHFQRDLRSLSYALNYKLESSNEIFSIANFIFRGPLILCCLFRRRKFPEISQKIEIFSKFWDFLKFQKFGPKISNIFSKLIFGIPFFILESKFRGLWVCS